MDSGDGKGRALVTDGPSPPLPGCRTGRDPAFREGRQTGEGAIRVSARAALRPAGAATVAAKDQAQKHERAKIRAGEQGHGMIQPSIERTATVGRSDFIASHGLWNADRQAAAQELARRVDADGVRAVRVTYVDLHGLPRAKLLSAHDFKGALRNGVAIHGAAYAMDTANILCVPLFARDGGFGIEEMGGAAEMYLVPDPSTFRMLPWQPGTGWVVGNVYLRTGAPVPFDTRMQAEKALALLANRGFGYVAGLEYEFHIFKLAGDILTMEQAGIPPAPPAVLPITHGFQFHSETNLDPLADVFGTIQDALVAMGIPVRSLEDEYGTGQVEITTDISSGIAIADNALLMKSAIKQICRRHGYHATFMAKPGLPNIVASGWHLHQSLSSLKDGKNAFASANAKDMVSSICRQYIGGLLKHAYAGAVFGNPTVTGFKRIAAQPLAPNRVTWAYDNKSAMLRIVAGYGDRATHIENRSSEPAANPYLVMATQILAGLDGIDGRIDPGEPADDALTFTGSPSLPDNLGAALDLLGKSTFYRASLGERFVDHYLTIKRHELGRYMSTVTDWEHREYFTAF